MKTNAIAALTLVFTLGMAQGGWTAIARPTDLASSKGVQKAAETEKTESTLIGTVEKIDKTRGTVRLKDTLGNRQTVKVDEKTEITREGNDLNLSDVQTGDVLVVRVVGSTL